LPSFGTNLQVTLTKGVLGTVVQEGALK
jgi:hypothetical protein